MSKHLSKLPLWQIDASDIDYIWQVDSSIHLQISGLTTMMTIVLAKPGQVLRNHLVSISACAILARWILKQNLKNHAQTCLEQGGWRL